MQHRIYYHPAEGWIENKCKWNYQLKAENGIEVSSVIVERNECKKISYTMEKNENKLGLFFVPLDENLNPLRGEKLRDFSIETDLALTELNYREGFLRNVKVKDSRKIKEEIGLREVEEKLGFETTPKGLRDFLKELMKEEMPFYPLYIDSVGIITPSLPSLEEVEKAAERRLRLLKDMAEDEKIVLSPIPVFSGNELFVPYVVYSYNPFSPSEERNIEESDVRVRRKAWFSFLQASRNSIDPFNSSEAFDFHSKYVYYEKERQWQYLVRNHSLAFGYSPLEEKEEDLKIQIIFSHNLAFPNPINLYLQAEMGMGNFFVHAFPTIPSLHEILSLCSLERALDLAVVNENLEKCPVEFHPLTALLELKSFAFDEDPRVYFIDKKFVEEHGSYFSDYLANASIIKRIEKKLIEKLKKVFEADNDVILVYLFGSYAQGRIHPLSDVDIAILLKESVDFFEKKLDLTETISKTLLTDEFDLVMLNEASPGLLFEIFNKGKVLVNKDENVRIEFLLRSIKKYIDTYPLRKLAEEILIEKIKNYAS